MDSRIELLLKIALAEEGYLEKASNSNLDSKTANAGRNNYTKYARDLDAIKGFYNGPKNGYAWCDVYVDWCVVQAFGVDEAKKLLNQPYNSSGAGCTASSNYYKQAGRFYKDDPKIGDQIFFIDSSGSPCHTGLVYNVDRYYVYTIEGNTSSASGVVANGGGVFKKKYSISYSRIYGYGRLFPDAEDFEDDTRDTLKRGSTGPDVEYMQNRLLIHDYDLGEDGADGVFGPTTEKQVIAFQQDHNLEDDGVVGPLTWAELEKEPKKDPVQPARLTLRLGAKGDDVRYLQQKLIYLKYNLAPYGADGDFGKTTQREVILFQQEHELDDDGVVGALTWAALEVAEPRVITTANGGLNVRKGPSTSYPAVAVLGKGSYVSILEKNGEWGRVAKPAGWINLTYVKEA